MDEERSYVIVKWIDGRYQIRGDHIDVLRWLETQMQCVICAEALTREEARALFKLYPENKRINIMTH